MHTNSLRSYWTTVETTTRLRYRPSLGNQGWADTDAKYLIPDTVHTEVRSENLDTSKKHRFLSILHVTWPRFVSSWACVALVSTKGRAQSCAGTCSSV